MLYLSGSCLFFCLLVFFVSRLFRKQKAIAEEQSTPDNNDAPQIKYDVFVSFRGEDIRHQFLSHLTEAFDRKKINAFVDDKLEKGDEIWSSLVEAIEGSFISLIIFSPDYASSRWCLKELVKIFECKEKYGQVVIPVFYQVDPTDVRHQSGSYKNAFAKHGRKHRTEVQSWRQTLNKSADLSGIESSTFQNDAAVINEIVKLVLKRLPKPYVISKELVGIEEKITIVESWIRKEPEDKCLIGIWGMPGIGKTTLAEQVFNKLQSEYEGCYFLANEREESKKYGIVSLKTKIFSGLLGYDVKVYTENSLPNDIVRRIDRMKVLLVLDDVNDLDHLEKLLGTLDNFGSGSRIIVTTRDEQVLKIKEAVKTYHLTEFSFGKALKLFNLNAFNQNDHQHEYNELSQRVVNYAKGIPLVVKVLARLLRGKSKEEWKSMLDKLKRMPPKEVYEVMKLSYDGLDHIEQQIFLDLACFLLRSNIKVNVDRLKSLLKDNEDDSSVLYGLERLKDQALITFSKDNFVSMHDSIQEMAWEIVRRESSLPGSRSRLWDSDDIDEALKNGKGIEAVRSLQIHTLKIKKQTLNPHIFAKMSRLQFLEIRGKYNDEVRFLAEGFQFMESELRYLSWDHYPLKSLPEKFSAKKLVILNLSSSKMEKLWNGVQDLVNLKEFDLNWSIKLKELPDLSKAINLEVMILRYCHKLTSLHPSIFSLAKLEQLELQCCMSLTILASDSHLCSLSLSLNSCYNLREFSMISENLKNLSLGWTKIKALPSSMKNLTQLLHLELSYCKNLQTIAQLPPSLETLIAIECKSLQSLPELPMSLETLDVTGCTSLPTLPELLPFLKTLDANGCTSFKSLSSFPSTAVEQLKENRKQILFWDCLNLDEPFLVAIGLNAQINVMKFAHQHMSSPNHNHVENDNDYDRNCESNQVVYGYPGSSVPEWLEYKTTEDYITIDLSSAPPSPFLGFIFCFVLGNFQGITLAGSFIIITVSDVEDEGKRDSLRMNVDHGFKHIKSDHVCVMYDQRCSAFLNSRAKNQTRFKIHVTMAIRDYKLTYEAMPQGILKGFGVSPMSSSTYNSFIQRLELCDTDLSMSQFR